MELIWLYLNLLLKNIIQLLSDTTEDFNGENFKETKAEWDELQKQDENKMVDGTTIKQLKISLSSM